MRAYGLPRNNDVEFPDVADIQRFGRASHVGRLPGKSGDFRPYIRGKNKAATRRYWKRVARAEGRRFISNELHG